MDSIIIAASGAASLACAWVILRRRAIHHWVGPGSHFLAPSVVFTIWLAGITMGEQTGSLPGMGVCGALPLAGLAAFSRRWSAPRGHGMRWWTVLDLVALVFVATVVLLIGRHDIECHRAVVGGYLRGNIPLTALNNPQFPIAYHPLFDAVVALVLRVLPGDVELGLDLVTVFCVALTLLNLNAISRLVFASNAARQAGRLFFVLGFGPTFIRNLGQQGFGTLHGASAQAYVAMLLRRPTAVGVLLFTLALGLLLPHFAGRKAALPVHRCVHPTVLLPLAWIAPRASEELVLFLVALLVPVVIRRRMAWRWCVAGVAALLLGLAQSGVIQGVLGHQSMAAPHLGLEWPPALPNWDFRDEGMPLLSKATAGFLAYELGPIFLITILYVLLRGTGRQRLLAAPALLGLLLVSVVSIRPWPKADLDRFLFYGTPVVFLLTAVWMEKWLSGARRPAVRALAWTASAALLVLTVGSPITYMGTFAYGQHRGPPPAHPPEDGLRSALAAVGPRQAVVTSVDRAEELLQAGFVVVAPLNSNSVGSVDRGRFEAHVEENANLAAWWFLPTTDARVNGGQVVARHGDHVLVPRPMTPPGSSPAQLGSRQRALERLGTLARPRRGQMAEVAPAARAHLPPPEAINSDDTTRAPPSAPPAGTEH